MKFINYLTSISGIEIYPMISFAIFFTFFTCLTIWAFRAKKNYISYMKNIPLDKSENNI